MRPSGYMQIEEEMDGVVTGGQGADLMEIEADENIAMIVPVTSRTEQTNMVVTTNRESYTERKMPSFSA